MKPMASDPLIAIVEAARERGVVQAVLLAEDPDGVIRFHQAGEWSGLELRGLMVFAAEIVASSESAEEEEAEE